MDAASGTASAAPALREVRVTVAFASLVGFSALCDAVGAERAYLAVTGCLKRLDAIARRLAACA